MLKIIRDLKRLNLKFYLNIVGIGYQYKLLKKYVHKNNLEDIVKFLGYQNKLNIKKILNRSDYLISCSYVETFGITIAESIASGVPVLCVDSGGPRDFVKNFNGFLLKDLNELKAGQCFIHLPTSETKKTLVKNFSNFVFVTRQFQDSNFQVTCLQNKKIPRN